MFVCVYCVCMFVRQDAPLKSDQEKMSYPYLLLKKVLNFHCGFAVKVICGFLLQRE